MKHSFKRLFSAVIALALVLGLLPAQALALPTAPGLSIAPIQTETDTYINPLYAGVLTEADLIPPDDRTAVAPASIAEEDYPTSFEDAAVPLREGMVNRQETIVVYYKSIEYVKKDHEKVYSAAVAHTGVPTEGDSLRWVFGGYSVSISRYAGDDGMWYITYTYTMTYYTTAEQEAELTAAVDTLLTDLNVEGQSDYRKLCAVYDYMCQNIVYDETNPDDYKLKHTAYAALMDKTAVCQGYAVLLYRLLLEMGIDNRLISGIGNGGAHGWNIVKLGDVYYNVDSTWDAIWHQAGLEYNYFLRTDDTFEDHTRDAEFLTEDFYAAYPMATADYVYTPPTTVASGECGDDLVWTLDSEGLLTIEGTGDMWGTGSDELWPDYLTSIKTVVISEGVTSIGYAAFSGCSSLTSVTMADSVTSISWFAFYNCSALTSVDMSENVTSISSQAFACCSSLAGLTIPEGVSSIQHNTFNGCSSLTGLVIPEGVTSIGDSAFQNCSSLTELTIPDSVTSIGNGVFRGCSKLTKVYFTGDAPTIGTNAFGSVTATCYYPVTNSTWTSDVMQNYGGTLTWKAFNPETGKVYVASGECGDDLVWTLDTEGLLVIEGTGDMWSFSREDPTWSSYLSSIKTVVLGEGVTSIGVSAFWDYTSLTSVTIPEGVTTIGGHAFVGCSGLTELVLPESVTTINGWAFCNCTSLTSVNIPEAVTFIGMHAFAGCSSLTEAHIPEGVTAIQEHTFDACSALTDVTIPEGVTSIGKYAFAGCTNLTSVTIPQGVTTISDGLFWGCSSLTSISIPKGVTSIGSYAFQNCSSLTEVYFTGNAPTINSTTFTNVTATCYYPVTNSTWTSDVMQNYGGTITWIAYDPETGKVYVAGGQCGNDLTWTLDSEGLLTIEGTGDMWDTGSSDLWPDYLTSIKTVVLGEGVTSIGSYAFQYCSSLTSVTIPEGVTSIGFASFYGCSSLTSVTIPEGVTAIGSYAFRGCSGLTSVTIPEGVTSIGSYAFEDCTSLTSISIPEGATSIGDWAFEDCTSLTSISIPEGVTSIGKYAFEDCSSLTEVSIPEGVTTISEGLFKGCTKLAKVSLPDNLTSIAASAFLKCNSLTELTIPEGVTSIGAWAFNYCRSLTSITIPEGVTSIGDRTFEGCTSLTSITMPDGITSIGEYAFQSCVELPSITIPEGVTTIGSWAFAWCSKLTKVYFTGDAPTIGQSAYTNSAISTCYYPVTNSTWTSDVMQNYGRNADWVPYGHFDIDFASMTMGNSLAINFAFPKDSMDDWTGCYAEIRKTYADDREDMVVTVPFDQWKTTGIGGVAHYYVTFNGIAAKEMTDTVYVTIHKADGTAVSTTKTDSVRDQSMRALAKEDVTDEEKTMIVDMLNYGAAAQGYFGYGADDLANAQLSEEQKAFASESVPCTDTRAGSGNFQASTVVLKSNIQMMFAFKNVDESHYAVVSFTNHRGAAKQITVPGSQFTANGSAKVVTVDALVVADGRQEVTCVVYDAEGNEVARVTDSLESYTARNNGKDALFTMMMRYSDSAYSFFHS